MQANLRNYGSLAGVLLTAAAGGLLEPCCSGASPSTAPFPQVTSVRSQSGQFIINAVEAKAAPGRSVAVRTNSGWVQLDPPLLSVSCERVKQILCRELGAPAAWRGKIYLVIHPDDDRVIRILAERFRDGWQYRVDLPRQI